MAIPTMADAEALALRCARREVPVYALAELLADMTGEAVVDMMFGTCADRVGARQHLKAAHFAATNPERAVR